MPKPEDEQLSDQPINTTPALATTVEVVLEEAPPINEADEALWLTATVSPEERASFDGIEPPREIFRGIPYPYSNFPDGTPRLRMIVFLTPDYLHPDYWNIQNEKYEKAVHAYLEHGTEMFPPYPPYVTPEKCAALIQEVCYERIYPFAQLTSLELPDIIRAHEEGMMLLRALSENQSRPITHFEQNSIFFAVRHLYGFWLALRTHRIHPVIPLVLPPKPTQIIRDLLVIAVSRNEWFDLPPSH